jgi:hypothetical protein
MVLRRTTDYRSARRRFELVLVVVALLVVCVACGRRGSPSPDAGPAPSASSSARKLEPVPRKSLYAQRVTEIRAGSPRGPAIGRLFPGARVSIAPAGVSAAHPGWMRIEGFAQNAEKDGLAAWVERSALGTRRGEIAPPAGEPGSAMRATFGFVSTIWYDRVTKAHSLRLLRCHEVWVRDEGATALQWFEGVELSGHNDHAFVWSSNSIVHSSLACPAHAVARRGGELVLVEPNPRWEPFDTATPTVLTRSVADVPAGYLPIGTPEPDPLLAAIERSANLFWIIATSDGLVCDRWKFERKPKRSDAGEMEFETRLVHPGPLEHFDASGLWYPVVYRKAESGKPAELKLETLRSKTHPAVKCECEYRYKVLSGEGDELITLARPIPDDAVAFDPSEAERWFLSKKACEAHLDRAKASIERDGRMTTRVGFHAPEIP